MEYIKKYFTKYRFVVTFLFVAGVTTYIMSDWYWKNICAVSSCDIYFIDAYLSPLREAGLVLAAVIFPFLLIPTWYFKKWLKYLAPYMLIFTVASMLSIDPNSSNMFNDTREEAMAGFLSWWLALTLIFITYHWYKNRK